MKIYTQEDLVKFLEIAKKSEEELSKITDIRFDSPAKQFPSLDAFTNLDSLVISLPNLTAFPEHYHAKHCLGYSVKNNYPKWLNYKIFENGN